jgi:hypothetical protein
MKTVFFFTRVTPRGLVVGAMSMLSIVLDRKSTANDRSSRRVSPYFENPTDHAGPVIHDVQAHPLRIRRIFRNALPIIFDQQCAPALLGPQLNQDSPRVTMLDRIIHCFLRDVIEMGGHGVIVNQHGSFTLKAA